MDFLKEWEEKLAIKITCSQVRQRSYCSLLSSGTLSVSLLQMDGLYLDKSVNQPYR